MADLDSFSSLPRGDDFNSGGTKKRKLEKGTEIVQIDSCDKQTSMIELPAIAINVAPLLPLVEALDLGSCSKYLNSLCECESTWKEWYIRKWGPLAETNNNNKGECSKNPSLNNKGWKAMYIEMHKKIQLEIFNTFEEVNIINEQLSSYEFFIEINRLIKLNIKFDDVYFFLLRKDINVVYNVIGIYYLFFILCIPVEDIKKAIVRRQLTDRQALIIWCIPQTTDYRCYLPQEEYKKVRCLGDIMQEGMNMLYLFRESNIRANYKDISHVKVSSKIPEPKSKSETECDCAECRPDLSGGPSSS